MFSYKVRITVNPEKTDEFLQFCHSAANWVDSTFEGTREEYNLEGFYRFTLFSGLDMRLSYQYVIDPAFTTEFDSSSVFSIGFRTVF